MSAFDKEYSGDVRVAGCFFPNGDFPLVSSKDVHVSNVDEDSNGMSLDELLVSIKTSISAITPKIKKQQRLDSVLEPNTQYFLSTKKTSVTLTFPSKASHGDSIYVQFVSGDSIVVYLKDQDDMENVRINSTSYKANSVIEIHALYGYIEENMSGWNAILHVRGVT